MKLKSKNILFLELYGGGFVIGGTEVYLKNLLKELSKRKKRSRFFLACFNKKNNIYSQYVDFAEDSILTRFLESWSILKIQYKYPFFGFISYLWGLFWLYHIAQKILKKNPINLVYSNGGQLTAIVAYLLHKSFGVRYLLHLHGIFNFSELINNSGFSFRRLLFKNITRNFLLNADTIIANSREVAEDVEGVKNLGRKVTVVKCFVDEDVFYPRNKLECRKKLSLNPEDFIIISTNRLERDKRIHFILKTVANLDNKNVKVIFIGDGPLRNKVQRFSERDKRIIYHPPMDNNKLPFYLNAADIAWGSCSINYISLTLIEALACGVPIMASDVPISLDINYGKKVDPKTIPSSIGFLVKENTKYVARLINTLANNREILERKREVCLRFYQQEYGEENIKKILKIVNNNSR